MKCRLVNCFHKELTDVDFERESVESILDVSGDSFVYRPYLYYERGRALNRRGVIGRYSGGCGVEGEVFLRRGNNGL